MIIAGIIALSFVILAFVIGVGKGDHFIAGYNTASTEERQQIDIRRLRLLMAVLCIIIAGFCGFLAVAESCTKTVAPMTFLFIVITIVFIILANTWTKKK